MISKRSIVGLVLIGSWFAANIEAAPQARPDAVPEETPTGTIASKEDVRSHSITDRFLSNMRSPIGFSMGVFELYAPNSGDSTIVGDKSPVFTMLRPRLFANAKGKRSQFQFDYTFGFKRYNRRSEIHSSEHTARLDFDYTLSRNATLQISDTFRSAFNDYGALPTSTAPTLYQPGFAQELYLPHERATTNSVLTGVNIRAGKRTNLTVFGSYDMWRYQTSTFANAQGFQIGIRGDHQINKWLFLNSSYSHYLNAVDPRFEAASIHRLQVGGLKFKLRRTVEIYFSGGADYTRFQGTAEPAASYEAGFSKGSGSTLFSAVYHRGLSTAVGPQTTFNGHVVSLSLTQWLTRRVDLQISSGYTRGAALKQNTNIEYLGGSAEIQIQVQQHVLFSVQSSYVSQRGANLLSATPLLNRYTVTSGIQFIFPSLGGRRGER